MALIQGSTYTHSILDGTSGDDILVALAAFTAVNGGGGSDIVDTNGGFDDVQLGSPQDNVTTLSEVISLTGQGNTVTGGDENFSVTDLVAGQNTISIGDGHNTVLLAGSYNNVTIGGGANNVDFVSGGNNTATLDTTDDNSSTIENIVFSGTNNVLTPIYRGSPGHSNFVPDDGTLDVSGGSGNGNFYFGAVSAKFVTGGLYNTVTANSGSADITPGGGHDTVILTGSYVEFGGYGGDFDVHLAGTNNLVSIEGAHNVTVNGGAGSSIFDLAAPFLDVDGLERGGANQRSVTTEGQFNSFALDDVANNTIATGEGGAKVTISDIQDASYYAPPGSPFGTEPFAASSVTFGGINNLLADSGYEDLTVTGGDGQGTFALGNGDDTLTTGGSHNKISAGAGSDTITSGNDNSIITLNGTNANLILQGESNAVFISSGASASINGASPDLHVTLGADIGNVSLNDFAFGASPRTVIALTNGAGGYTDSAQIISALQTDGHGGSLLHVGSGSLDIAALPPSSISAATFVIKT